MSYSIRRAKKAFSIAARSQGRERARQLASKKRALRVAAGEVAKAIIDREIAAVRRDFVGMVAAAHRQAMATERYRRVRETPAIHCWALDYRNWRPSLLPGDVSAGAAIR